MSRALLPSCLLLGAATLACGEIIDRIAVTVNDEVVTQSDLGEEIRISAFLNGEEPDFSPANKRRAAERIVERLLLRRDMELTRFPQASQSEVDRMLQQVRQGRFQSEAAYRSELARYGVTEAELRQSLLRQAAVLRYIDFRFAPDVQLTETEIRNHYENRLLPELRKRGLAPEPSYDEAHSQAEESLKAERVDELVDRWLKEARERARIRYQEDALQ